MKLDFFLLADAVDIGDAGKLTIRGAEVTRLSGTTLPFRAGRLATVAGFLVESGDAQTSPAVAVRGWNPDGTGLFQTPQTEFNPSTLGAHKLSEGEEPRLSFVVALDGLEFRMEGAHRIEVELDGTTVGSRTLAVVVEPSHDQASER